MRFGAICTPSVGGSQNLFHHQAAQAVAYENQRDTFQFAAAEKALQYILGPILDRHYRAEPIRQGELVIERPCSQSRDVTREPGRPKRFVFCALAPGVVSVTTQSVNKHNIETGKLRPTGDLEQFRHARLSEVV